MQRYTFSTFNMDVTNREAYEVCRATADLKPVSPMPIILLGDEGCGKTHLLYSVVNQIRSGSGKTGLAYVTAREFPEKVRSLVKDPAPVQRAASAILMVDQLEKFTDRLEELEAVVRIFLDNNHYVLMASSVHPDRLNNLSFGLRGLIKKGRVVRLGTLPASTGSSSTPISPTRASEPLAAVAAHPEEKAAAADRARLVEIEAELRQQREAYDALRAELLSAQNVVASARQELEGVRKEHTALQREYDTAQANNTMLRRDTEKSQQSRETLESENERLRRNYDALRREVDTMRTEQTELERRHQTLQSEAIAVTALRSEVNGMREEFARLEKEREALAREAARGRELEDELEALRRAETELRRQLVAAREESLQKETDANRLVERAGAILSQVEEHRVRFVETEDRQRDQIHSLETMLAEQSSTSVNLEELETVIREREALRAEFDNARREWGVAREQLTSMVHIAQREASNLDEARKTALEKIGRLTAEHAAMQLEIVEGRERLKNLDALQGQLNEAKAKIISLPTLQQELAGAREQLASLRTELMQANEKLVTSAMLEEELIQLRLTAAKLADAERELEDARKQLEQFPSLQTEVMRLQREVNEYQTSLTQLQDRTKQQEETIAHLRVQADRAESLQSELTNAMQQNSELEQKLSEAANAHAELIQVRASLEKAQETIQFHTIEMDALRHEAAAQVAAANAQAGDVEREYARLCTVMDQSRQAGTTMGSMLKNLHSQVSEAADNLIGLSALLDQNTLAQMTALANAPAPGVTSQGGFDDNTLIPLPGLDDGVFFEAPKDFLDSDSHKEHE